MNDLQPKHTSRAWIPAPEGRKCPICGKACINNNWFARTRGMEWEPERGIRCTKCFDMRFERTALYAFENDFPVMASFLGISRWKDMEQVNDYGRRAAGRYDGLAYWGYNWKKGGGSVRMIEIRKREEFYQQEYCG